MDTLTTNQPQHENIAAPFISQQVDQIVRDEWNSQPGIGNKLLLKKVQARVTTGSSTDEGLLKAYIKAAKHSLLYTYKESSTNTTIDLKFVQRKLQERQSLRAERRLDEADKIASGLQAMGVAIDDHLKQWSVTHPLLDNPQETPPQEATSGIPCQFCNRYFASRNLVFAHLRNPVTPCGNAIFAANQTVPLPPSSTRQTKKNHQRRQTTGSTAVHADHALWMGDLPLRWTVRSNKYLGLLLREYLPPEVPPPWIQRVHRKAYKSNGQHLGYAIVVFRDQEEMELVLTKLNRVQVSPEQVAKDDQNLPSFTLRVKPATAIQIESSPITPPSLPGIDPPMEDQLRPYTTQELIQQMRILGHTPKADHAQMVQWAARHIHPRPIQHHQGRLLPTDIQQNLLLILQTLRWTVPNSRNGLTAERYLVLPTNQSKDRHYGHLRQACRELMDWADPNYYYSGIAVTRNFVASPHIDDRDQSFQYAVSLGDFDAGGELVVVDRSVRHVVETKNRIARVDGRHVHWVRTWTGGDRFSLIFYDTTDRFPTPIIESAVDVEWCSGGESYN